MDSRVLKTPARRPLVLPTRALAMAIASEWELQRTRIQPFTMPLMSLAATALDAPKPRDSVVSSLLTYVATDALLCRAPVGQALERAQAAAFDPLVEKVCERLGLRALAPSHSIFGGAVAPGDAAALARYLDGLDSWELAALEQLAGGVRSVLLAIAGMEGMVGVAAMRAAARLEEEEQLRDWGRVEGGHDIDEADAAVRVAAPTVFIRLLRHA